MMMKPLEEKRIQDNKRAKYGNVAERKAYGLSLIHISEPTRPY